MEIQPCTSSRIKKFLYKFADWNLQMISDVFEYFSKRSNMYRIMKWNGNCVRFSIRYHFEFCMTPCLVNKPVPFYRKQLY
ncbi:hypothetical protein RJ53_10095 [Methanocalculus chunghsingensis]|uniref:Transposase n=1 Tax=Methanocalculus chunghsingensis TaxID=156457 RepID=A0A8J8B5H4_9EURY|nr:hypothetical protein [Methanocalculus chunghsingensis]